jgi:hypothetical protein
MAVVGRRTPTGDSGSPAILLKRLDFPLPVAPARATTVWSPLSDSRMPDRPSTVLAGSSRSAGTLPSTRSTNLFSAVTRDTNRSPSTGRILVATVICLPPS